MKKQQTVTNIPYVKGLDGIRFLGIIGVIIYHLAPQLMPGGYLGVNLFFVLSGYLITDKLIREIKQTGQLHIRAFYRKRMKRLLPSTLFMLVLVLAWITWFNRELLVNLKGTVVSALLFVNNWWQIIQGDSYFDRFTTPSPFVHLWSLAVEMQFYILIVLVIWGLFTFLSTQRARLIAIGILTLLSAGLMAWLYQPGVDPSRVYYGTDTRLFSLWVGTGFAAAFPLATLQTKQMPQKLRQWQEMIGLAVLFLIGVMMKYVTDQSPFNYYGGMLLFSLLAGVLIIIVAQPTVKLSFLFRFKPVTWLGKRSFVLYLWHYPLNVLIQQQSNGQPASAARQLFLVLVLTLGLAEVTYRFIEMRNWQGLFQKGVKWAQQLWKSPRKAHLKEKGLLAVSMLVVLSALTGFAISPTDPDHASQQVKKVIEKNEQLLQETQLTGIQAEALANGVFNTEELSELANKKVTFIGDSVLLSASEELVQFFPAATIDGKVGRQLYQTVPVVQQLKKDRKLNKTVVIELGSNGDFTKNQLDDLVGAIGKDKEVYFLTTHVPRHWRESVNQKLVSLTKNEKHIHLIDWSNTSTNHADWFYEDAVHPNKTGAEQYAVLIAKSLLN
ncbi:acyltransferase family protein [Carnobacterium mobile]|uniref:acyltransferase family protein n=1 Tax=Carnobacterium mobile TaxID=2750 RepID=UPI0005579D5E|nr:acyltransferase family protein [Carnobacterium mobile]